MGTGGVRRAAALAALLLASRAVAEETAPTVELGVGAQAVVSVAGIARVAIGDPAIADVKPVGDDQVLVVGRSEGRTTLIIWKTSGARVGYVVIVHKRDPAEVAEEVRRILGTRDDIRVRTLGDRVLLEGFAATREDQALVEQILTLFPSVRSLVKLGADARRLAADELEEALARAGLRDVHATVIESTIFLEGSVESQQDLKKADLIIRASGERIENLIVVGVKRMVLAEVQFIEVRRANDDRIGLKLPTDLSGTASFQAGAVRDLTAGTGSTPVNVAVTASSQAAAQFVVNDGSARLLAQPRLVCASGEKAEFLAGGEIPLPQMTANAFSVDYKQFGIKLAIRPTADRYGNIQTEIDAEASEVDRSVGVSAGASVAIPGFRTRRVKTNVTVRHGETIVMSGLFEHDEQKSVSKVPLLGHIPVIGELFKSRVQTGAKRELIIIVTPRIVGPDTERVHRLIDDTKRRYRQAKDEVGYGLFD